MDVTIPLEKIGLKKLRAYQERYHEVVISRDNEDPSLVRSMTFDLSPIRDAGRACRALEDLPGKKR